MRETVKIIDGGVGRPEGSLSRSEEAIARKATSRRRKGNSVGSGKKVGKERGVKYERSGVGLGVTCESEPIWVNFDVVGSF